MEFVSQELASELKNRLQPLIICLSHAWGGLEQVAAADARDLGTLGIPVRVLCLEGTPIHESLAHHKEVQVVPLNFRPKDHLDLRLRRELKRLFKQGVNLIHCHQTSLLGSIVPWLYFEPKVALLASRHILNNHSKKTPYHRAIYARLDGLIVMSQMLRRNILETHPLRRHQIKVINLGLDFERFDPEKVSSVEQRAAWGADQDTTVIGLVGRIDPAKGQATFIRAAAGLMMNRKGEEKLKFVMVGEETLGRASTYLEELKSMVSQFHLDEQMVFAGYQENIPEVMCSFDLFVMPSMQEAFGLVAIEAMAMGRSILISNGGSASEIIGKEQFGLLIKPDDAYDLQRQLRYMLDNPQERLRMGNQAREHVKTHYDRRVRLQKTLTLYREALHKRGI